MPSIRYFLLLTVAAGVGCASKNDTLGGSGGAPGTGGVSCARTDSCGGTTGTGGGTGGSDPSGLQGELTMAEATWSAAKTNCPIYAYEKYQHSVFGSCSRTIIEMDHGQPIRRSFVSCAYVPDGGTVDQWDEIGAAQIGTHDEGGTWETVEQLLADCQALVANVAASPSGYRTYVNFNAEGVPLSCQATVIQCVDDCTEGNSLDWFTCESSPSGDAGFNPG
jgi:hypothetical protein